MSNVSKEASIQMPSRGRESDEDEDITELLQTSQPLLGEREEDSSSERQIKSSMWDNSTRWHRSRRRQDPDENRAFTIRQSKGSRRRLFVIVTGIFVALGIFQLIILLLNLILLAVPDRLHDIIHKWGKPGHIGFGLVHWPTDFSRDIIPKSCHSHNDYWRRVPLFSGIEAGCIGTEADIWLYKDDLYVGHSIGSLTPNRTLNSLYINPLLDILARQNQAPSLIPAEEPFLNGVFDTTPEQTLIFMIDFKTSGSELFPHLVQALEPFRSKGYLSYSNGTQFIQRPVTVVGTGNTPFDKVLSVSDNPHRDIFFDAPLDTMTDVDTSVDVSSTSPSLGNQSYTYNSTNSYYASASFKDTIGHLHGGEFSEEQLIKLRSQVADARRRGLKSRYWETPGWPISLRNHVWSVLVREGVDILNVDDLKGATKGDWSKERGWVSWH